MWQLFGKCSGRDGKMWENVEKCEKCADNPFLIYYFDHFYSESHQQNLLNFMHKCILCLVMKGILTCFTIKEHVLKLLKNNWNLEIVKRLILWATQSMLYMCKSLLGN